MQALDENVEVELVVEVVLVVSVEAGQVGPHRHADKYRAGFVPHADTALVG